MTLLLEPRDVLYVLSLSDETSILCFFCSVAERGNQIFALMTLSAANAWDLYEINDYYKTIITESPKQNDDNFFFIGDISPDIVKLRSHFRI